jgi:hypothetical protein
MKVRIYRTFKYQAGFVAVFWPLILLIHFHWSGYGFTNYLQGTEFLRPLLGWLPGANAYNTIENCGLPICGYPLTWLLHGVGLFLVGITLNLGFKDSNPWKEGLLTSLVIWVAIIWEKWELLTGVTILRPELFGTIAQATNEGIRLLNDTVNDILFGGVFLTSFLITIVLLDRHFGYEYVQVG